MGTCSFSHGLTEEDKPFEFSVPAYRDRKGKAHGNLLAFVGFIQQVNETDGNLLVFARPH
jgi:hypothetical protein